LIASEPVLVVTQEDLTNVPQASSVPFAAVTVIVTLPVPVAELLVDPNRKMPAVFVPVPEEVPVIVIEPEPVVTMVLPFIRTPLA
jgi:hypothetical protein